MPNRSTRPEARYLREMLDAATAIRDIIGVLDLEALRADSVRRDAVLWNYTVLGEAAAQLPSAFKESHPEVSWASKDLPPLAEHLAALIARLEQDG